jgi:hypothetical protein
MKFLLAMLVLLAALVFCAAASEPKIAAPYGFHPSSLSFFSVSFFISDFASVLFVLVCF